MRRAARGGLLVALEGIDGAGKSTLSRRLAAALRRRGRSVRLRREPVDPALGRLAQDAGAQDAWTGAIYFTVDRHLAGARLRSDLARYDVVLSDRSLYSTLAYQGSRLSRAEQRRLGELQRRATVLPDRVLLLDLPVTLVSRRISRRAEPRGPLERERYLAGVANAYRRLARQGRWTVLDARSSPEELLRAALAALALPPGGVSRRKTLSARTRPRGSR